MYFGLDRIQRFQIESNYANGKSKVVDFFWKRWQQIDKSPEIDQGKITKKMMKKFDDFLNYNTIYKPSKYVSLVSYISL